MSRENRVNFLFCETEDEDWLLVGNTHTRIPFSLFYMRGACRAARKKVKLYTSETKSAFAISAFAETKAMRIACQVDIF